MQAEREAILERYQLGFTITELAVIFPWSRSTIFRMVDAAGMSRGSKRRAKKVAALVERQIQRWHDEQLSIRIAEQLVREQRLESKDRQRRMSALTAKATAPTEPRRSTPTDDELDATRVRRDSIDRLLHGG
jgi:RNase H-fold protein (predicted Holliday junction resolvase)